jgi:hypothetical protein
VFRGAFTFVAVGAGPFCRFGSRRRWEAKECAVLRSSYPSGCPSGDGSSRSASPRRLGSPSGISRFRQRNCAGLFH